MILLKDGLIYDGSENPPFQGSVIIDEGIILQIIKGRFQDNLAKVNDNIKANIRKVNNEEVNNKKVNNILIESNELRIIDCTNLCISPGFIDAHSHNDFFAAAKDNLKYFKPFIEQGVTTMVSGNCGFSASGYLKDTPYKKELGGGLFDIDWQNFSSFENWGKAVNNNCPLNILSLIGHGSLRISLNSTKSNQIDKEHLNIMLEIIDKSLKQGAAGVSFGLMYVPGRFAPKDEIIEIAKLVKKNNKIISFHARAYSKVSTSYSPPIGGKPHGLRAIEEVIDIARKTETKTQLSHLIFVGKNSWGYVDKALTLIEKARDEGIDIMFDTYSMDFGASIITVVLPSWYLALAEDKRNNKITRLRAFLEISLAKKFLGFDFNDILISDTKGYAKEIEGKTIYQLAKNWKISEFAAYLKVVEMTKAKAEVLMFKYSNEEILEKLRNHELALYMSDAWVKDNGVQNYAIYYNFPKFILLAKNKGTPIELVINKMTGAVAKRYNIMERGFIKEGLKADITIFDLNKLNYKEKSEERPEGIEYVFINGKEVLSKGKLDEKIAQNSGEFIRG